MLRYWLLLLLTCVEIGSSAESIPYNDLGQKFLIPTNVVISWEAPPSQNPSNIWTYRVLPSQFSFAAISNLMKLGPFTYKDQVHPTAANPVFNAKGSLTYESPNATRTLGIYPNLGWIYYSNTKAVNVHSSNGVPFEDSQVLALATNYLSEYSVECHELAINPQSSQLQAAFIIGKITAYSTNHTHSTIVNRRGVMIPRAIDGIHFWAKGTRDGVMMEFGTNATISKLQILWRKLERKKQYHVAKPETILKWIRGGKAFLSRANADDLRSIDVMSISIKSVTPYYFGESHEIIQHEVLPFAVIEAVAAETRTNIPFVLYCPIIEDAPD